MRCPSGQPTASASCPPSGAPAAIAPGYRVHVRIARVQNWYCLVHFPDGTSNVYLIPGPAPILAPGKPAPIITIAGEPGAWRLTDCVPRARGNDYAAAIWVEPHEVAASR